MSDRQVKMRVHTVESSGQEELCVTSIGTGQVMSGTQGCTIDEKENRTGNRALGYSGKETVRAYFYFERILALKIL